MSTKPLRGVYIDASGAEAVKKYQYRGADLSYIYIYVLQPMNSWLLQHVIPMWIAPNLMSLIGFAATTSCLLVTSLYSPYYYNPDLPSWLPLYVAFSFFFYQTIDNLDGRQARRTGSSSPLGLLFDHGVDAMTVTVGALTLGTVYQYGSTGNLYWQLAFWYCGTLPFVFATWSEYYTNELILDVVNGPSDGMCLCMLFCVISYFVPSIWYTSMAAMLPSAVLPLLPQSVHHLPMSTLIQVAGFAGIIPTIVGNVVAVQRQRNLLKGPLKTLVPFLTHLTVVALWAVYSPSHVFHGHPRLYLMTAGLLFANLVCKLMLAHLTAKHYNVYRLEMVPYLLAILYHTTLQPTKPLITETATLYALFVYAVSLHLHFIVHVIDDMTTILNIKCFDITEQLERTRRNAIAVKTKDITVPVNGSNGNGHSQQIVGHEEKGVDSKQQ